MTVFQHPLWGYELTYPDDWAHRSIPGYEIFATIPEALQDSYQGPLSGQILVKGEWNCARQPIEPLWTNHIGRLASMLGAHQVGSAPWRMAGAVGMEAEILMPKRENRRLWTGILSYDFTVLQFLVTHPREERVRFQPAATQIISSLRFLDHVDGLATTAEGLPLPAEYVTVPPRSLIADIPGPGRWRAYTGPSGIDALQAFYLREAPHFGWTVEEYVPFPSPTDLGFARLRLRSGERTAVLGILPSGSGRVQPDSPANLAIQFP